MNEVKAVTSLSESNCSSNSSDVSSSGNKNSKEETSSPSKNLPNVVQITPLPPPLSTKGSGKKRKPAKVKKPMVVANVLNTEYDVIKEVLKKVIHCRLSYEPESDKSPTVGEWDLYWNDLVVTPEILAKMRSYQKANHFPGMECLSRKNLLGKNLMRMRKMLPKEYNFFPPTWVLPLEWNDFKKQFNNKPKTFIVKPEALSQGKGIFLVRNWNSIDPSEHYVVQRYLHKPFLIDGLKFDLRIYVLVYGCDPYRIFIYDEGLARLATEKYSYPSGCNIDNMYMHLTNYAINKDNENFQFNTDANKADVGHKRSLDFVWKYVEKNGGDSTKLRKEIQGCILKTFCAVQPILSHIYRSCQPNDLCNDKCFELLGFDILLDHKLKPWLLEVNHAPSFSTDTPFDYKTKFELLTDTFTLLRLSPNKRIKYERKKAAAQQVRLVSGKGTSVRPSKEERAVMKEKKMRKRDEYEAKNCGKYVRIYPSSEDNSVYEKYIAVAADIWEGFTGGKKKHAVPSPSTLQSKKEEKKTHEPAIKTKLSPYMEKGRRMNSARGKKPPTRVPRDPGPSTVNKSACGTHQPVQNTSYVAPADDPAHKPLVSVTALRGNFCSGLCDKIPRSITTSSRPKVIATNNFINILRGCGEPRKVDGDEQKETEESVRKGCSRTEYMQKWRQNNGSMQLLADARSKVRVNGVPLPTGPSFPMYQAHPRDSSQTTTKFFNANTKYERRKLFRIVREYMWCRRYWSSCRSTSRRPRMRISPKAPGIPIA